MKGVGVFKIFFYQENAIINVFFTKATVDIK